jgi:hypothetical protein
VLRIPTNADTVTTIADTSPANADTVTMKPPKCPRSLEFVSAFRRAPHLTTQQQVVRVVVRGTAFSDVRGRMKVTPSQPMADLASGPIPRL